ncbi:MAG: small ribosomal subunit biogenesis GTPase RsgA [Pseudomonadota bacterium]
MSKRKLSRQQAWRVAKIQRERAERAARRDSVAEQALQSGKLGPEQEGVVIAHFGSQVAVETAPGKGQRCHLRANIEGLVTGDRVVWCAGETTGVVVARLERYSELCRLDSHNQLKPVAANIDRIGIVVAPQPYPQANLIDRYLVAAEASGIVPLIILNKTDLLQSDSKLADELAQLLAIYPTLGYELIRTCSQEPGQTLQAALNQRTSVLVGQSGVGKSSLVNALVPDAELRVGGLSEQSRQGTHTTTTAHLLHLMAGGRLIDSPGIREFGLWHMDRRDVELGFREFAPFLGHCKFRDCQHAEEPGCAILSAVDRGLISPHRLDSYRQIVASLEVD